MSDEFVTYKTCGYCGGSGLLPGGVGPEYTCPACLGVGERATGAIRFDQGSGKKIINTYEIAENTDTTEYAALSDNHKEIYNNLASMGTVDMADGTAIRARLWLLFDGESTTRANILTLLGE